ncbi:MAG: 4-alpha-glucanotransferase [Bacteroidales bacterium]|nr:4-alpha-glucanotransferase [Bacteroidales bacterium]
MKLIFNIDYHTNWGESLYICGSIPQLGGGDPAKAVPMTIEGASHWYIAIDLYDVAVEFDYTYIVRRGDGSVRYEWGKPRHMALTDSLRDLYIYDQWQDQPADKPYYSSAFTQCIMERKDAMKPSALTAGNLIIETSAPMVAPDETVAICGNIPALGSWDPAKAPVMSDALYPRWRVELPLEEVRIPLEFKFIIVKRDTREIVAWELHDNRHINIPLPENIRTASVMVAGTRLADPKARWRGAGVAIPVFSLRSEEDMGVGDFYDLKKMADWAAETGQKFIQILPINDTTMTHTRGDSYPYNANSTFALHPMYLRLSAIGRLRDAGRQEYYENMGRELNKLKALDYEKANNLKTAWTREFFLEQGKDTLESDDYRRFMEKNRHWLLPYAAFCVVRDKFGTPDMRRWGEYSTYSPDVLDRIVRQWGNNINYWCFIQYHLDRQMRHVANYAHSIGVALKGDVPIGISRTSVDAWVNPRLFNLDCQAGAPPDDFSVMGQNWGFPTYNWQEMSRDGFAWWKDRFRKMAEYFDAYRIDHVLGFFRIWQIPEDAIHGLLGVFNAALPFSPEELREKYNFWINTDRHTRPYIMDDFLHEILGENAKEAKERFLVAEGDGRYRLKEEYDTQRKVANYFAEQEKSEANEQMCNALMTLIDDVLFIEDPYEKGKYHPRISAQSTHVYRSLTDYEKGCFNTLYNDFFYYRHNDFWYEKALWKLPPLIDATDMLVCAEDLGMIPACVPAVMDRLKILSLEIERMPKEYGFAFGDTQRYPYFSVCTTSTHDMGGIRKWWEEDPKTTQKYYNEVLNERGEAPKHAEPWICDRIISLHLASPSMLCILPLQDWLSIDGILRHDNPREEQINEPANPRHYWCYRMHMTIEQLAADKAFTANLRRKVEDAGR